MTYLAGRVGSERLRSVYTSGTGILTGNGTWNLKGVGFMAVCLKH